MSEMMTLPVTESVIESITICKNETEREREICSNLICDSSKLYMFVLNINYTNTVIGHILVCYCEDIIFCLHQESYIR